MDLTSEGFSSLTDSMISAAAWHREAQVCPRNTSPGRFCHSNSNKRFIPISLTRPHGGQSAGGEGAFPDWFHVGATRDNQGHEESFPNSTMTKESLLSWCNFKFQTNFWDFVVRRAHRGLERLFSQSIVGPDTVQCTSNSTSIPDPKPDSEPIPHSGLRGEGEEGLGLKISPQNNRNLEEIDTKDVKSRSSYENMLRWPRKVTSKYI